METPAGVTLAPATPHRDAPAAWPRRAWRALRNVTPRQWDAVIVWLVALAAAVLSYDALVQLAADNGARGVLPWVWPLVLDLAALGFLRKWLAGRDLSALTVTLAAIATVFVAGLSIAGNIVDHTLGRALWSFEWWIAAGVGGIAPLVFLVVTALEHRARLDRAKADAAQLEPAQLEPAPLKPARKLTAHTTVTAADRDDAVDYFAGPRLVADAPAPARPLEVAPQLERGDHAQLEALGVAELRAYARHIGVPVRGSREQIRARVLERWARNDETAAAR